MLNISIIWLRMHVAATYSVTHSLLVFGSKLSKIGIDLSDESTSFIAAMTCDVARFA